MLLVFGLAAIGGGCVGYALCLWRAGAAGRSLANAERQRVLLAYRTLKDGRNSDNYEPGRYEQGER